MIRLLLADDHHMFRQGVARMLADIDDFSVVAQASTCGEAVDAVRHHAVDVAVIDLSMPGRGGPDLIGHLKSANESLSVLVLTMHGEESHVTRALRAGADGYLTKENAAEELCRAIRRVAAHDKYVCANVAERLALGIASRDGEEARPHTLLTEREYKVFELLVTGLRGQEIAEQLSLSEKTVSTHKSHVLRKLNALNRTELVLYAIKHGIVPLGT